MNPVGDNIATWGRPAELSDFMIGPNYRYFDLPDGEYSYQESLPLTNHLNRKRINIKVPTTAAAFKAELESRSESQINQRATTAVRRPTITPRRQMDISNIATSSDEQYGRSRVDHPDIVSTIKQRSLFHSGKTKKPKGKQGGSVYGSLYGW